MIVWPPDPDNLPSGLVELFKQLMQARAMQQQYASLPVSQMLWPGAQLQYAQQVNPNWSVGAALMNMSAQQPNWRVGVGYHSTF